MVPLVLTPLGVLLSLGAIILLLALFLQGTKYLGVIIPLVIIQPLEVSVQEDCKFHMGFHPFLHIHLIKNQLPCIASFDLPDLDELTKYPIFHDPK